MRYLLLILIAATTLVSCSKKAEPQPETTLNVTTYKADYNGVANSVKASYFLLPLSEVDLLKSGSQLMEKGPEKSIREFYAFDAFNKKAVVPTGEYYLAVQRNITTSLSDQGRFAYKKITINPGDQINVVMVFAYMGIPYREEPWNENKN